MCFWCIFSAGVPSSKYSIIFSKTFCALSIGAIWRVIFPGVICVKVVCCSECQVSLFCWLPDLIVSSFDLVFKVVSKNLGHVPLCCGDAFSRSHLLCCSSCFLANAIDSSTPALNENCILFPFFQNGKKVTYAKNLVLSFLAQTWPPA